MWQENFQVYGARKVWKQLKRESIPVARCTVERLMKDRGLQGARRGKAFKTTIPDTGVSRPADWVDRQFAATRPDMSVAAKPGKVLIPSVIVWFCLGIQPPNPLWAHLV